MEGKKLWKILGVFSPSVLGGFHPYNVLFPNSYNSSKAKQVVENIKKFIFNNFPVLHYGKLVAKQP